MPPQQLLWPGCAIYGPQRATPQRAANLTPKNSIPRPKAITGRRSEIPGQVLSVATAASPITADRNHGGPPAASIKRTTKPGGFTGARTGKTGQAQSMTGPDLLFLWS